MIQSLASRIGPLIIVAVIVPILFCGEGALGQIPDLEVSVADVVAAPGEQQVQIPVYLSNVADSVAGFELYFQLSRPDICTFDIDSTQRVDTSYWQCTAGSPPTCTDSVQVLSTDSYDFIHIDTIDVVAGGVDLTGSLIQDWALVDSRSQSGIGVDLKVIGLANVLSNSSGTTIAPQSNGLLFNLVVNCVSIPDTATDRTADILLDQFLDFSFSDPQGNSIGLTCFEQPDTAYYRCTAYSGDVCLNWERVFAPPYDSTVVTIDTVCQIDTNLVHVSHGSVTLCTTGESGIPGDVDGNGNYDISDLTMLINFAVSGNDPLPVPGNGDLNGDCCINWYDVELLQAGGPFADPSSCDCSEPVWCCCMGMRGNVDYDVSNGNDDIDIADLTFLVSYMFDQGASPPCHEEANVNGSADKSVDISDLTDLVAFMFGGGDPLSACD